MISYNFEILGKVQAKERPRMNTYTGKAYTPGKTKIYENWVKQSFLSAYSNPKLIEGPIKVKIIAFYNIPKVSKKKQQEMISGLIRPTIKPDTDNVAKGILDSLNGIAYLDDKQVVSLSVEKRYSFQPRTIVCIEEIV